MLYYAKFEAEAITKPWISWSDISEKLTEILRRITHLKKNISSLITLQVGQTK